MPNYKSFEDAIANSLDRVRELRAERDQVDAATVGARKAVNAAAPACHSAESGLRELLAPVAAIPGEKTPPRWLDAADPKVQLASARLAEANSAYSRHADRVQGLRQRRANLDMQISQLEDRAARRKAEHDFAARQLDGTTVATPRRPIVEVADPEAATIADRSARRAARSIAAATTAAAAVRE